MRAIVALFLTLSATCLAGEKAHFFGTWEPRPALAAFWRPIRNLGGNRHRGLKAFPLARHCKEFAEAKCPGGDHSGNDRVHLKAYSRSPLVRIFVCHATLAAEASASYR